MPFQNPMVNPVRTLSVTNPRMAESKGILQDYLDNHMNDETFALDSTNIAMWATFGVIYWWCEWYLPAGKNFGFVHHSPQ